jgi:hypothetical protein
MPAVPDNHRLGVGRKRRAKNVAASTVMCGPLEAFSVNCSYRPATAAWVKAMAVTARTTTRANVRKRVMDGSLVPVL